MIIVGIDPGLHVTGYSILKSDGRATRVLEAGIIKTDAKGSFEEKLNEIFSETGNIIAQFRPNYIAIEELYSHYVHPKTAIIMGHARGVIFVQAARSGIPVVSYAATRIKKSLTGNGRATKQQMQRMIKSTLKLRDDLFSPDTADALAVALCHHNVLMGER
ncbi:MAG: crossover junction endodeoxyribonuclease RuvC [Candidatus Zixiibacteriota bacterium]|nr:MAG: crossover junction endodeoxyribonuclease RuvC [candidate division Zixibacteria bacterium]